MEAERRGRTPLLPMLYWPAIVTCLHENLRHHVFMTRNIIFQVPNGKLKYFSEQSIAFATGTKIGEAEQLQRIQAAKCPESHGKNLARIATTRNSRKTWTT